MTDIQKNREELLYDMADAAYTYGRNLEDITLMAVSKTHPFQAMEELFACGQLVFGENRVQEAQQKLPPERPEGMQIHLIGHLQTNKAKKALELFDAIDSVDSLKLAQKLESLASKPIPILLELKTAPEESKSGFEDEHALFQALETLASYTKVRIKGLMTIGPLAGSETEIRKAFALLRTTAERAKERFPDLDFTTLSMGMSYDYRYAIAEGSTLIRVGTRLFGRREG
ncbi:MAG: YggS family pyridoxal phosphate-dependent enzyme [Bacilli bacterium]|nr:YggS family pyridoxal phosphate-dependent enzyme [Bacilli bacterium]